MKRKLVFSLNNKNDRTELSTLLKQIPNSPYIISDKEIDEALKSMSDSLGQPDWLCANLANGTVGPYVVNGAKIWPPLPAIIQTGRYLLKLSSQKGFEKLTRKLRNIAELKATLFEIRVAHAFFNQTWVKEIEFENRYSVRGKDKYPDFDLVTDDGRKSVECKTFDSQASRSGERMKRIMNAFEKIIAPDKWPKNVRMELSLNKPPQGDIYRFANWVVEKALALHRINEQFYSDDTLTICMGHQGEQLKLNIGGEYSSSVHLITDRIATPTPVTEQTSTYLVGFPYLENQMMRTISRSINGALRQLPDQHEGIIALGNAPLHLVQRTIEKLRGESAYKNVKFCTSSPNTYEDICVGFSKPKLTIGPQPS